MIVELPDEQATTALGYALARLLRGGDLVLLTGPLGAGKTTLTQGIGASLGVRGRVLSPTFVLARIHRGGRLPLVHVDAYRLGVGQGSIADELETLDLEVDLPDAAVVAEWGEGVVESLAEQHLSVGLDRPEQPPRRARLSGNGDWPQRLQQLVLPPGLHARPG